MPKQPSGGLLEAGLYTHKQFSLYSTYCTVSTTVCGPRCCKYVECVWFHYNVQGNAQEAM